MADVNVNIFTATRQRGGVSVPRSGVIIGDPLPNPVNPDNGNNQHNSLSGIQGGVANEYFHLTSDEYDAVLNANAPDSANPFATIADIGTPFDGNPSSLNQEGATDGQAIIWNNIAGEWQPTTIAAGSSKWTDTTGGIYRDGSVAIGQTTIPSAGGAEYQTFSLKSKVSGAGGNNIFATFLKGDGNPVIQLRDTAEPLGILPYATDSAVTIGNITGFSGARGLVIRPNTAGQSIITTDTAGTTLRFAVADTGQTWINGLVNVGVASGTLNAWGMGVRGFGNNNASRMSFVVQRSTGTVDFQVASNGDILTNGNITIADDRNFILNATTGTKIGTATTQKLAFWNKTPIIQPTTSITGATLVGGAGTTITSTDTFGGYTLQQIAAALINVGILA